jgi:hypothetical protein
MRGVDHSGKQFGSLLVISKDLELTKKTKRGHYLCECLKCGNKKILPGDNILKQKTCGCGQGNERVSIERYLINCARGRAKQRKIEFTITEKDIEWNKYCPLLGMELYYRDRFNPKKEGSYRENSASLDRIDSSKGYVPGNVWVISTKANRLKNNATLDDMKVLVENWQKLIG